MIPISSSKGLIFAFLGITWGLWFLITVLESPQTSTISKFNFYIYESNIFPLGKVLSFSPLLLIKLLLIFSPIKILD